VEVTLPNHWTPRDYQIPLWTALESGVKRAACVWHRRAGKDLTALNWTATEAFRRVGLYWHLLPTYSQGRKIVWEGMDREGRPFLDAFPDELISRKRDDEMTLWLVNGSRFQVVGTDHIDRLVGANPIGVTFSEYSLHDPAAWELIRPMLAENGGTALFIYTYRGRNHGYKLLKQAEKNPNWFAQVLTVDDTDGAVSQEAIDEDRASGMPEELIQQEYYCSPDAPLVGSYYGEVLTWMADQTPPRIGTEATWVPNIPVETGWDLGIGDSTAIWFGQQVGHQLRLIDYMERSGEDISFYAKALREKPYVYGNAYLPHDAAHRELGTGKTIMEQLQSLGVRPLLQGKFSQSDQIAGVRLMLRQAWIHEENCERGLQSLREFVKQPIEGERGPSGELLYRDQPLHNWASHGASALATLILGLRPQGASDFKQPDTSYVL